MNHVAIKVREKKNAWVEELKLPAILKKIYARRTLHNADHLDNSVAQLANFQKLTNVDAAVELLFRYVSSQRQIVVVGDFDADGATSTALVIRALQAFNHFNAIYLVPNRFDFGYGLSPELVAAARQMPNIEANALFMTVDNGIACHAGVAAAKAAGFGVLITDHHLPAETLPNADVIVNPNLPNDQFVSKSIAGVGVAFYLMLALRAYLRDKDWFVNEPNGEPNLAKLLDLVALGTVADVVSLDHTNRILVEQGLQRIRQGQANAGINALIKVANRNAAKLVASDIGFAVAPRLNAAGRLDDMSIGIECLLSDDPAQAERLASVLDQINTERREIQQQMSAEALAICQDVENNLEDNVNNPVTILYKPEWHQGVVGVVASKVKGVVHKPTIVFAQVSDSELKGSARSIEGINIRDVFEQLDKIDNTIMLKYGGHAMAAGVSIVADKLTDFMQTMPLAMQQLGYADSTQQEIFTDGELATADITLNNAWHIRKAGPWGQAFPEPSFQGQFIIQACKVLKDVHIKLQLTDLQQAKHFSAIAFNQSYDIIQRCQENSKVNLVYRLDLNDFRGSTTLQLLIEHIDIIDGA